MLKIKLKFVMFNPQFTKEVIVTNPFSTASVKTIRLIAAINIPRTLSVNSF